ncbi:MAG: polysaccharide deacetylase family protein [Patescibacteria group bacterium]
MDIDQIINGKKKVRKICFTLDLEEDFAGRLVGERQALSKKNFFSLKKFLDEENILLSIFVQGKLLSDFDFDFLNDFKSDKIEFHLHSYSHNFKFIDSENDLNQGIHFFKNFFGYHPKGYRAPEGRISLDLLNLLKKKGFLFDSSLFPTFFPKPKYYFRSQYYKRNIYLTEIPISGLFFNIIPFSLSWMKVVGEKLFLLFFYFKFRYSSSEVLIFTFHLHDLWEITSLKKLPFFWRIIFSRNKSNGFNFLRKLIKIAKKEQLSFELISNLICTTESMDCTPIALLKYSGKRGSQLF